MGRLCRLLFAFTILLGSVSLATAAVTIRVPPQSTFLRTSNDPGADTTLVVDLQALGITNGMVIKLERLGDYTFFNTTSPDSDYANAMLGVFSFTNVVTPGANAARVPAALSTTLPAFVTATTLFGGLATDIPQDFGIGDSTSVRVPAGGNYLMISSHDVFYGDNRDPDGDFAVRITVLDPTGYPPASCLWSVTTNTTLAAGDFSHENCVVTVSGATLTVAGRHQFAALSVVNGGVVTSPALDSLRLGVSGDVVVNAGAAISVDGKGYPGSQGPGAGQSSGGAGGGGHGGAGGDGLFSLGGTTYGSFEYPMTFGSGGGADNSGTSQAAGGVGGGALQLTVQGELQVAGSVRADGKRSPTTDVNSSAGGGAGGSILLNVGSLSGSGSITANGAQGGGNTSGGGGGGGRIAIYTAASQPIAVIVAAAASSSDPVVRRGAAGTIYLAPGSSRPTLIVDSFGDSADAVTALVDSVTTIRGDFAIRGKARVGGKTQRVQRIDVEGDLFVAQGAQLTASGLGYPGSQGPGAGQSSGGAGGGGHGGAGGDGLFSLGGTTYGSFEYPMTFGSGGGADNSGTSQAAGGVGGGALQLTVQGELQVAGSVRADGKRSPTTDVNSSAGGGAGGSILLNVGSLSGSGSITANGAQGGGNTSGGGGGGGRIAIYTAASQPIAVIVAAAASSSDPVVRRGAAGTIYLAPGSSRPTLIVDSFGDSADAVTALVDSVTTIRGDFAIRGKARVGGKTQRVQRIDVEGDLFVAQGAQLTASGLGYPGSQGPGAGQSSGGAGGGGHGGAGGDGLFSLGGTTYGSFEYPMTFGSGGGADNSGTSQAAGGVGGGALQLTVQGELQVAGSVRADGKRSPTTDVNSSAGGGAGGSILLNVGSLSGSGSITANGAQGGGNTSGGGGGGGRIAIYTYCWPNFAQPQVSVAGGTGYRAGQPGTIYPNVGITGIAQGVIATTGSARRRRIVDSFELGALESNDSLWVFSERGSALPPPTDLVAVDISQPGTVTAAGQFTPAVLDTGTYVSSHVLHFDPVGNASGRRRGSVTFDTNVLGIIVTSASLAASDAQLKRPELVYATSYPGRGAEFDGSADQDTVTLSADRRTVTFVSSVSSGLDEIRVVTAVPPGSCGAVDAPPVDPIAEQAPRELFFAPPAPNPARGSTVLTFALPHAGPVSLDVYDVTGRRVANLATGVLAAGRYTRRWDGTGRDGVRREAGVYFARLTTRDGARTQRVTLMK